MGIKPLFLWSLNFLRTLRMWIANCGTFEIVDRKSSILPNLRILRKSRLIFVDPGLVALSGIAELSGTTELN